MHYTFDLYIHVYTLPCTESPKQQQEFSISRFNLLPKFMNDSDISGH